MTQLVGRLERSRFEGDNRSLFKLLAFAACGLPSVGSSALNANLKGNEQVTYSLIGGALVLAIASVAPARA
jgi:hypothetical protein